MKRLRLIVFIAVLVGLMSACQPTPEKETVVNKADGDLQKMIEATAIPVAQNDDNENVTEHTKEKWQANLEKGRIFITVDAEISIPDVDIYPVLSVIPIQMNQEWADKAYNVFFDGAQAYKWEMTKEDIEKKILIIKRIQDQIKNGNYSIGFEEIDYDYLQNKIDNLMNIFETAPYENELTATDTTFEETHNGQFTLNIMDIIGKVGKNDFTRLSVLSNPTIKYNGISFLNYDNNGIAALPRSSNYDEGDILKGVSINSEEAKQIAQDYISRLGIEGIELKDINTVNIYEVLPMMNRDILESEKQAYELVYEKTYNGIPVSYFDSRMVTKQTEDSVDTNSYSAVLEPEKLIVHVDDSGVVCFDWKNPTTSDKAINENVQLLSFERIKEIFENNIFHHYFYDNDEGSLDIFIDRIVLSYFIQPMINSNDEYMAIPVWDFINEGSGEYNSGKSNTYLTINAIDGSVINRDKGY